MKNRSLRFKLTFWFSSALIVMTLLAFLVVFSVSWSVLQKTIRDGLIRAVEDNVDEVEFYRELSAMMDDGDDDHYILYGDGYLEIDDDYLDQVNGIYTALYAPDGALLYGENPIYDATSALPVLDGQVRSVTSGGIDYYVMDRKLKGKGEEGLWLRGIVSERQGIESFSSTVTISLILLPSFAIIAIVGGLIMAKRALRPVEKMSETVSRISTGSDLKKRLQVEIPGDELGKMAGAVNDMMDRLEASFEAERQFTSDVSHELRTPLSVIQAQCDFSLEDDHHPEQHRDALVLIRRQTKIIQKIISDMLDMLRMENRTDAYRRETVDWSELVSSTAEDMALIRDKNMILTYQVEPGIQVEGDQTLLLRVLNNLIANAFHYGKQDGTIRVTLKAVEGGSELAVVDNGVGIAPDQQEMIFRRFYQVSPSRNGTSVGLGLAMVRQIVRYHGGEIQVKSVLHEGSTFTVFLPGEKKSIS